MYLIVVAIGIYLLGGVASFLSGSSRRAAMAFGVGAAVLGAAAAAIPAGMALAGGSVEPIRWAWNMPLGSFSLAMDGLSALFVLPIVVLPALAAIYGSAYLDRAKSHGRSWLCFNLLAASMVLLVVARNGLLFLVAWEVMSLSSFFLVTSENEKESVRQAGWTYLIAMHLGTAFLLVMFLLLGRENNSLDFENFTAAGMPSVLFLLAVIGFGTKAGFLPLHVWLPEAHPAAPSHVSAVMSGVMIKTGIYGLVRTLTFLGPPLEWWGWVLIGVGVTSGILGVLLALSQSDLKRLLAYSSVENIGIITLSLGVGLVGLARGNMTVAVLGFAGGLLHVVNHALFKGLLFLGAGAVLHATGTREIDRLGGLIKKMPWTAATFLIASVAIAGLPPLNGFISELLIFVGSLKGMVALGSWGPAALLAAIGCLALIGGLAAACFAKAGGVVFLGEPRTEQAAKAHEVPSAMLIPMIALALACILIGLLAPLVLPWLSEAVAVAAGLPVETAHAELSGTTGLANGMAWAGGAVVVILGGLLLLRRRLLAGRKVETAGTWDCGYVAPTARMQYTASSFAEPLTEVFQMFLRTRREAQLPTGLFPREASLVTHTPDLFGESVFRPAFQGVKWLMGRLQWLQHGRLQLYVLYIVLALLILLAWKLG